MKSYAAAPTGGKPVVGSGPFRLVQGTADGSTFKFEANPDYWGGAPHVDEVIFQFYKNDDSADPGADQGRGRLRRGHHRARGQAASRASPASPRTTATRRASTRSPSTPARSTLKTGKPIGNPNPAVLDPKFRHALGYALNLPQLIKKVYQGAGTARARRSSRRPTPSYHWEPPADQKFTFDLDQGRAAARRGGLQEGLRRASARCPTASRSARCGWPRAPTRRRR